jgi:4-hydroxyacetophenone monooxygenase
MLWRYGDGLLPYLRKDPAWPHPERSLNAVNDRHRQEMTDHIAKELANRPDLIAKCIPSYPPYGKRILLDNGWYQSLLRPNVVLVTEKITRLSESAVHTADGQEHPADIVVLSTGYQITEMAAQLNISGVGAVGLRDAWGDDNATAYLGITVPDFPNFFIMQGPSTGLGHGGSQIFQAECQVRYITTLLARLIERNGKTINVRRSVYDRYVERVDELHKNLIWTHPGMSTYYRNKHGRVVSVSPFSLVQYWHMTHDPDLADYAIIG